MWLLYNGMPSFRYLQSACMVVKVWVIALEAMLRVDLLGGCKIADA